MSTTRPQKTDFPVRFLPAMAGEGRSQQRGERIEALMAAQGWSPSALARELRVDRARIYAWKRGDAISSDMLERLAIALESSRGYIETGEGDPRTPREDPPALILKEIADALGLDEPSD